MKVVVIGGTGLIGSKTVAILRQDGHKVVAASPQSGINTITGEGLKEAMVDTTVVIDLANSLSDEDEAVMEFFETSGRNLLAAEVAAGVKRHVAHRMPDNGYYRAKVAQEKLIEASGIPYTIVRPTEFMEFLGTIAARTPCVTRVPVLASYGRMNALTRPSESRKRSGRPRTREGGSIMRSDGSESNLAARRSLHSCGGSNGRQGRLGFPTILWLQSRGARPRSAAPGRSGAHARAEVEARLNHRVHRRTMRAWRGW